jgi:hypothetical protein
MRAFLFLLLFVILFAMMSIYNPLSIYHASANSPSIGHQGVPNTSKEPFLIKNPSINYAVIHTGREIYFEPATNYTDCKINQIPRLSSVSYFSNGRTLNSTFWLSGPPLNATHQEYPFVNATDIDQAIFIIGASRHPEFQSLDDLIKYEEKTAFSEYELINISKTRLDQNSAYKLIFTGNNTNSILGDKSNITLTDI